MLTVSWRGDHQCGEAGPPPSPLLRDKRSTDLHTFPAMSLVKLRAEDRGGPRGRGEGGAGAAGAGGGRAAGAGL